MSFPTIEFAAFFVVVFVVSWALMPHPRAWRPFILAASYFFFHERTNRVELFGIALVIGGILILLLS